MTARFSAHAARTRTRLAKMIDADFGGALRAPPAPHLVKAMRYALRGGKTLRGALVLAGAEAAGKVPASAWRVALAVECMHAYSLAHDDLPAMDDAVERRGRKSLHKAYDEAHAILAGDALQALALELVASAGHAQAAELCAGLARAAGARGMAGGQSLDLLGKDKSASALVKMHEYKTGALIIYAMEAGARLGGARAPQRARLVGYARDFGLAFQLADDIRDAPADAKGGQANLALVLGEAKARAQMEARLTRACARLAPFGARARLLRDAADFVRAQLR